MDIWMLYMLRAHLADSTAALPNYRWMGWVSSDTSPRQIPRRAPALLSTYTELPAHIDLPRTPRAAGMNHGQIVDLLPSRNTLRPSIRCELLCAAIPHSPAVRLQEADPVSDAVAGPAAMQRDAYPDTLTFRAKKTDVSLTRAALARGRQARVELTGTEAVVPIRRALQSRIGCSMFSSTGARLACLYRPHRIPYLHLLPIASSSVPVTNCWVVWRRGARSVLCPCPPPGAWLPPPPPSLFACGKQIPPDSGTPLRIGRHLGGIVLTLVLIPTCRESVYAARALIKRKCTLKATPHIPEVLHVQDLWLSLTKSRSQASRFTYMRTMLVHLPFTSRTNGQQRRQGLLDQPRSRCASCIPSAHCEGGYSRLRKYPPAPHMFAVHAHCPPTTHKRCQPEFADPVADSHDLRFASTTPADEPPLPHGMVHLLTAAVSATQTSPPCPLAEQRARPGHLVPCLPSLHLRLVLSYLACFTPDH
ncbi:hypothetical protein DFH06DRAFT_1348097 [Mycena polygramma]|nr:hypothetical protein DFH06DRAFT_1348097 [Mycena polygramma]